MRTQPRGGPKHHQRYIDERYIDERCVDWPRKAGRMVRSLSRSLAASSKFSASTAT